MSDRLERFEDTPINEETATNVFLDHFYPIHYSIGMRIETGLRVDGTLDRHQTAIMWILRSENLRTGEHTVSRKNILRLLTNWYDIPNSGVSRALRALSKEPLNLITLEEDPESGREKQISLTAEGTEHCQNMMDSARDVIRPLIEGLSLDEKKMTIFSFIRLEEEFAKKQLEQSLPTPDASSK